MGRSAGRLGTSPTGYVAPPRLAHPGAGRRSAERRVRPQALRTSGMAGWLGLLARVSLGVALLGALVLLVPGFVLDTPQPDPPPSDAVVVISGDEQLARFREGVSLFHQGYGRYLVVSGAAYDNGTSNADVMHDLAVARGVPEAAILEEPLGEDTWGNAVHTRQVLQAHGLHSAILVTSPYHLRRAEMTFEAAYAGSGIQLAVHAAPDSEWRKLSWWQHAETRRLTLTELQKLAYITATGQYH